MWANFQALWLLRLTQISHRNGWFNYLLWRTLHARTQIRETVFGSRTSGVGDTLVVTLGHPPEPALPTQKQYSDKNPTCKTTE